ncbi:hypothetical protein [Kocuria rosea]|uniref:hypothetical protein n=1 Tax=Kocuria rosea TaxID=1275 RepID=UPI0025B73E76|nr:hypothetical protein [Kocuria rosea]WJZ65489.1 hypothetical protein QR564_12025 [Kocuria rosea]
MKILDYVWAIRSGVWLILALTILGTGLGALLSTVMPVNYTSTSSVLITPSLRLQDKTPDDIAEGDGAQELMRAVFYIDTNYRTYAAIAEQPALLEEAAEALTDTSLDDLRATITVDKPTDAFLVTIRAQDVSIRGAEEKARQVAQTLMSRVASTAESAGAAAPIAARMTDSRDTTAKRVTPGTGLIVVTVAVFGFYAGCVIAWIKFSGGGTSVQRNESASGWQ